MPRSGAPSSPAKQPSGCRFHPRCYMAKEICAREEPLLREVAPGHWAACHFAEQVSAAGAAETGSAAEEGTGGKGWAAGGGATTGAPGGSSVGPASRLS